MLKIYKTHFKKVKAVVLVWQIRCWKVSSVEQTNLVHDMNLCAAVYYHITSQEYS